MSMVPKTSSQFGLSVTIFLTFFGWNLSAADSIFPDPGLEAAVRQEVFAKRYNDEPLTADDVKNISRVIGKNKKIASLEGLQHCKAVLEIDLENNAIVDISPIRELKNIQSLNLAGNKIESIEALSGLTKIQYLELSRNRITSIDAISGMTNMRSLYLSDNHIRVLKPLSGLKKVWSLYVAKNPLEDFSPIGELKWLETLDLTSTGLADLTVLNGLTEIKRLTLSDNIIVSLEPLVKICEADASGPKRFAPYLKLDVRGNPLSKTAIVSHLVRLRELDVRIAQEENVQK